MTKTKRMTRLVLTGVDLGIRVLLHFLLFLYISIALLTPIAFEKLSRPQQLTLSLVSLHAIALQATVTEGLAQGPYMVTRAGFEPTTLQQKGIDSTNVPTRLTKVIVKTNTHTNSE